MNMIEFLKALVMGVVEGITEWLPISSTGHMILVDEFMHMQITPQFKDMFLVVIQLGAILAVVLLYFDTLMPLKIKGGVRIERHTMVLWGKILVACIPAAVVGLLWDDQINALFYNFQTVSIMLILFGVLFIVIERRNRGRKSQINSLADITLSAAFIIGLFQLVAAVFPGTSRSGSTIIGGLLIGVSRKIAAEFTFLLAVPVMLGASLLKLVKFGFSFTGAEIAILLVGMAVAFVVSLLAIKFLLGYIRKHDFTAFGWYRIALGVVVLNYFAFFND